MANEEALFVVISINEPAGDAVGAVGADFADKCKFPAVGFATDLNAMLSASIANAGRASEYLT
ncbi:MAG: hypothetical protein GW875_15085 [Deltaproteobacteria bacterium]|nr:hypothetical protein [Deltaproteobacteria bacterium]